jgi:hypothetical protein
LDEETTVGAHESFSLYIGGGLANLNKEHHLAPVGGKRFVSLNLFSPLRGELDSRVRTYLLGTNWPGLIMIKPGQSARGGIFSRCNFNRTCSNVVAAAKHTPSRNSALRLMLPGLQGYPLLSLSRLFFLQQGN